MDYATRTLDLLARHPRVLVIDTETTGLRPDPPQAGEEPRVWEVAAVAYGPGTPLRYSALIDIGAPLHFPDGFAPAGFDPLLPFRHGMPRPVVLASLAAEIGGLPLVGHNIDAFDAPILVAEYRRAGLPVPTALIDARMRIDTRTLARAVLDEDEMPLDPRSGRTTVSLAPLTAHLGLRAQGEDQAHRALADCLLTARLLDHLVTRMTDRAPAARAA